MYFHTPLCLLTAAILKDYSSGPHAPILTLLPGESLFVSRPPVCQPGKPHRSSCRRLPSCPHSGDRDNAERRHLRPTRHTPNRIHRRRISWNPSWNPGWNPSWNPS